nr:ribonuclease H-like domain-containing protein [Tanacetum cinerariifolium]
MSLHGYSDHEYEAADDQPTLISKLDLSSPLHLHPNDSATLTVEFVKLKGTENYQVWYCAMLLALEGKNKTGFLDGSCRRSNTNEVLGRQWDRVNAGVLGWILNSISEELFLGQIFSKRAQHVWDELKETYDKVDSSVTFNLHHKINSLSQNGSSIADYYHSSNVGNKNNAQRPQASVSNSRPSNVTRPVNSENRRPNRGSLLISKLLSLIKEHSLGDKGKGVQANMAGANQHLTYTDKNLVNTIDISYLGIKVFHPNETEALIAKVGNLNLTKVLTLYDVLVVPKYSVTLVSVHKVARDSKFIVRFDESKCFLMSRDLMDAKIIEIGRQVNDLYYFENMKVHEGLDTSYDDNSLNVHDHSDGSHSSQPSSPTIDHYESDLGHS